MYNIEQQFHKWVGKTMAVCSNEHLGDFSCLLNTILKYIHISIYLFNESIFDLIARTGSLWSRP